LRRKNPLVTLLEIEIDSRYRFPVLEIILALLVVLSLVMVRFQPFQSQTLEAKLLSLFMFSSGLPLLIIQLLIIGYISSGFAGEIEKGITRTFLSYPIGRGVYFASKLISLIITPVLILSTSQLIAFGLFDVKLFLSRITDVFGLTLAMIGPLILLSVIFLLVAIVTRKSGTTIALSIILWLMFGIFTSVLSCMANITRSYYIAVILWVLSPIHAFQSHYQPPAFATIFKLTLVEAWTYLSLHYAIIIVLILSVFIYFKRRFEI